MQIPIIFSRQSRFVLEIDRFQFFDDERVLDISYDGLFCVRTAKRTLLGRQLVGADGAYSVVNRVFSIGRPKGYAVAVEVTLSDAIRQRSPSKRRRASTSS